MSRKIALITGANKGLGLEIGRQLGRLGMTVLLGARSLSKAEEAASRLRGERIDAVGVELDVTDRGHISAAAQFVEREYGKLDVLVNNAGVYLDHLGPDVELMRRSFEVNVFGAYALTEALLPLLKASAAGRIVNQSSIFGSIATVAQDDALGIKAGPFYSTSKAALNMLAVQLSARLKGTNVKVNAAHPGWVKTDLGGRGAEMEVEEGAATAVRLATLAEDGPSGGFFHGDAALPW